MESSFRERVVERIKMQGEDLQMWHELDQEVSPHIDARFMKMAQGLAETAANGFFTVVDEDYLRQDPRPDAVNHKYALLGPNVSSTAQQEQTIGLLDLLVGDENSQTMTAKFSALAQEYDIFERVKRGKKIIIPSNHLELPDQGLTLGFMHRAAKAAGIDRFETYATLMLGRLLGYYQLGDSNVIDDILRHAASVLKTFPATGGEKLDESGETEIVEKMKLFRAVGNNRTNEAFSSLMESSTGQVILLAGSGSKDTLDANNTVHQHTYGEGTRKMLAQASRRGAVILPLFVDYAKDVCLMEFDGAIEVNEPDDAHQIGEVTAALGNKARGAAQKEFPEIERFKQLIVYDS